MKVWNTKSNYKIFLVSGMRSNVFLLTDGVKNILIDTSVSGEWNTIQNRLKRLSVTNVDYLIITHAHIDHASNASRIKKTFNTTVVIHKDEAELLEKGIFVIPEGTNILSKLIVNIYRKIIPAPFLRYEPCKPDIILDSYYDLKDIGFNGYLLHTPGHTRGSVSLILDDELAIVGDALFGMFKNSVFPPFAEDTGSMIRSWGKLLGTKCSHFLPSHGNATNRLIVQKDYEKRRQQI